MACLDTSVILDLAGRGGRRRQAAAEDALRRLSHDQPHAITRFTLAELLVGFELRAPSLAERRMLDALILPFQMLEFDALAMRTYAMVVARLNRIRRISGAMDMLIASVALANGQRFMTRNVAHFQHVPGLRLITY
jgi:predicted nucleic acid-binding protein